jgi:isopentenyl diphosphate isomerase/L-lactate dehydrogenase-like FMN-dependent dehydrogenase
MRQIDYDYMAHSTDTEWTKRRNRHAFEWADLIPRAGVTADQVDASTELFGIPMKYPIVVGPSAFQQQLHPTGEIGMYEATTANGTIMAVSHNSNVPQEDLAAASTGPRWIQIYPSRNLDMSRNVLDRYHEAGAKALIFTVDQQATRFDRQQDNRWLGATLPATGLPPAPGAAPGGGGRGGGGGGGGANQDRRTLTGPARYGVGAPGRLWYNWDFMEEIREYCRVPVIIKGLMTPEDARLAIDRGFDGIIVSNHGGRSLDYAPSTLEVLEDIVTEVDGRVPVMVDSGFRRGSDVMKALALGADAILLGRAARWGLGAFGAGGAQRVLEIMQAELREAMALTGRRNLAMIDRTAVRTDFP